MTDSTEITTGCFCCSSPPTFRIGPGPLPLLFLPALSLRTTNSTGADSADGDASAATHLEQVTELRQHEEGDHKAGSSEAQAGISGQLLAVISALHC